MPLRKSYPVMMLYLSDVVRARTWVHGGVHQLVADIVDGRGGDDGWTVSSVVVRR